jgi:hypothetical protein
MVPRACPDTVEERKISYPCRESNLGLPDCSPLLYRPIYSGSSMKKEAMVTTGAARMFSKRGKAVTKFA